MVMTPDTRPSRPTRDPETDPRPFFESPSQSRRSDAQPRSRCSLLLVLFPSSLPLPSLRHSWWKRSNFSVQREMFVARRERRERRVGVMVRYIQRKRARLEGRWSRLEPSWTYGLYYGLSRSTRFGASCTGGSFYPETGFYRPLARAPQIQTAPASFNRPFPSLFLRITL